MPLCRSISYDSDKNKNNNNSNNSQSNSITNKEKFKIVSHKKNKKEIDNYNYLKKRNLQINNLNNDFLSLNKKIFFSTENNTNNNTNCNSNSNSNNNTLIKRRINKAQNCADKYKKNIYKTGKTSKSKSFYNNKTDISKEVRDKNDRKKLSFDIFDTKNNKNSKDILRKICSNFNGNTNTNQNSLIIRFENKQIKKFFDNKNNQKDEAINEDNCYQFLNENDQGGNIGINSVKTNNFIINKPKEENLKYSSIKEYLDDNDEHTEVSPSQISKIIIGQIEGYNDIIEEDKNININDKSRSLLELLSKFSFSNLINNKQSLENTDNLNFLEESNNDFKYLKDFNDNWNNISNSKNITSDNMPNLTKIKNVDEDNDSEDLSISVFKNNIKSINTQSNIYLNKIFNNKSNNSSDVNKSKKKNINYKKFVKNSINTDNTTVSSGNNNNIVIKGIKDSRNKDNENMSRNITKTIYKKNSRKVSPGNNIRNNFTQFNNSNGNSSKDNDKDRGDKEKSNFSNLSKNEKNSLYLKNNNRSKILKNIETTQKLNTIKSTSNIYKNLDTNILFYTNKKNNKILKFKNINELVFPVNKFPKENKKENDSKSNNNSRHEKEEKKIEYANATMSNINGENETIINANFFDIENEFKEINEKNDEKNGDEIHKNNERCNIY